MAKAVSNPQTGITQAGSEEIVRRLRREMEARISYFAQHRDQIDGRLQELEHEWDIERVLETNAAGIGLVGILMARHHRKWLVLPFAVTAFLLQHAIEGWCPPVEIFRRLGLRTSREINDERAALKVLRGDFEGTDASPIDRPQEQT